jgi:hypothetical protein
MLVRAADRAVALELADDLPEDLLTLAVPIGPRGIKEIAAQLDGAPQLRQRLRVV